MNIDCLEGEREKASANHQLGNFELEGIPPGPKGSQVVRVTFSIDAHGILEVSAEASSGGSSKQLQIKVDKGRLSQEEIDAMIVETEIYRAADKERAAKFTEKQEIESLI